MIWKRTRRFGGRALSGSGRGEARHPGEGVGGGARRKQRGGRRRRGRGRDRNQGRGRDRRSAITGGAATVERERGLDRRSVVPRRQERARQDLLHHGRGGDRRSDITGGSSTRSPPSRRGRGDGIRGKGGGEGRDSGICCRWKKWPGGGDRELAHLLPRRATGGREALAAPSSTHLLPRSAPRRPCSPGHGEGAEEEHVGLQQHRSGALGHGRRRQQHGLRHQGAARGGGGERRRGRYTEAREKEMSGCGWLSQACGERPNLPFPVSHPNPLIWACWSLASRPSSQPNKLRLHSTSLARPLCRQPNTLYMVFNIYLESYIL